MWKGLIAPHLEAIQAKQPDGLVATLAWKHFFSSTPLFQQALQTGLIQQWLESESDAVVDLGLSYLRFHEGRFSSDCATLLAPFAGRSDVWKQRLVWFMQLATLNASREMFELFLRLLADGTLDEARGPIAVNSTFWNLAYDLSDKNPARVCEVVAGWLARQLELVKTSDTGEHVVTFPYDNFAQHPIGRAAEREPFTFVTLVFPVILSIASWASRIENNLPRRDRVWGYLTGRSEGGSPQDLALGHLRVALQAVAAKNPEQLAAYVDALRASELNVANILLLAIYSGNGAYYANVATETFTQQPWRFESGLNGNSHWYAQQAIEAIFDHADADHQVQLEAAVLQYVSPWEKTPSGYKCHGSTRFNLLAMIPPHLRSAQGTRVYEELERKFGTPMGEPAGPRGGFVGSPIPNDGLSKMDDNAILASIQHFSKNTRPRSRFDFLRGGPEQLARAIASLAEKDPPRFAQIALRLPPDTDPIFFAGILRVFENAPLDDSVKLELCSKAFAECRDGCGREIADVLGAIKEPLPEWALKHLEWLSLESSEPPFGQEDEVPEGQDDILRDPFNRGLNLTRGRAVLAIGHLILHDTIYVARFTSTLERLTNDKSVAVQACATYVWRVIAGGDYHFAYEMFQKCRKLAPLLPTTEYGFELIRIGLREHFSLLRPLIEEMFRSGNGEDVAVASQLACIAALTHPEAEEMANGAVTGNDEQRLAAARVAAANLGSSEFRPWCEKQLLAFFNDHDSKVRQAAGDCFRTIEDQPLGTFGELIEAYCRSEAYETNSFSLLHTLEQSVEMLPGIVCMACELFLQRFGREASDIRTHRALDGYRMPKLAFRIYHQHQRDEWASRALDVIDLLCEQGVGETFNELREFDR